MSPFVCLNFKPLQSWAWSLMYSVGVNSLTCSVLSAVSPFLYITKCFEPKHLCFISVLTFMDDCSLVDCWSFLLHGRAQEPKNDVQASVISNYNVFVSFRCLISHCCIYRWGLRMWLANVTWIKYLFLVFWTETTEIRKEMLVSASKSELRFLTLFNVSCRWNHTVWGLAQGAWQMLSWRVCKSAGSVNKTHHLFYFEYSAAV